MIDGYIKEEMRRLIESVKAATDSPDYIICYKEKEEIFKQYFRGYEILIRDGELPDKCKQFLIKEKDNGFQ